MTTRNALIEVFNVCPKCLNALEKPARWLDMTTDDRLGWHTIWCAQCKHVVNAKFFQVVNG